ncbi:hypothetical protein [Aquimarina mytili]|uniref:Uncharacterized protein n=1 Tax=Aquimarina mytili TaxID=874423 RepID=A0A936ZU19_9FLAO|nr:hypothetical protein [Aquimarina mytili]MBL0684307.1 hypothetical protein [Aquimarina mytili]
MEGLSNFQKIGNDVIAQVKKHPKVFLSIPVFLGGFWQFYELISMGLPYGRYFSATQLLADGILILLLISVLIIGSVLLTIIIDLINGLKQNYDAKGKSDFFQIMMLILIFQGVISIFFSILMISYKPLPDTLTLVKVFILLLIFPIFFVTMVSYIEKLKSYWEKKRALKKEQKEFSKKKAYSILFCFALLFGYILLNLFHNFLLKPNNLSNLEHIYSLVDKKYPNHQSRSIKYFNDKYIFVEVIMPNDEKKIQKYQYKEVFANDDI